MSMAETTVNEAQGWFRALAGKASWGEPVERGIARASRAAGVSPRQGKRLWYGDLASVPAHIYLAIKAKYEALEAAQERRTAYAEETARIAQERGIDDAAHSQMDGGESFRGLDRSISAGAVDESRPGGGPVSD